jgi:DNA-binding transcriptional MerR regulator
MYTIAAVARHVGYSRSSFYSKIREGIFPPPKQREDGRPYYTNADIETIKNIIASGTGFNGKPIFFYKEVPQSPTALPQSTPKIRLRRRVPIVTLAEVIAAGKTRPDDVKLLCKKCKESELHRYTRVKDKFYISGKCLKCEHKRNKELYDPEKQAKKYLLKRKPIVLKLRQACVKYLGSKCSICDAKNVSLDFHHRNPEEKDFTIAAYLNSRGIKSGTLRENVVLQKELNKCDLMCRNCHSSLHEKQNFSRMVSKFESIMKRIKTQP